MDLCKLKTKVEMSCRFPFDTRNHSPKGFLFSPLRDDTPGLVYSQIEGRELEAVRIWGLFLAWIPYEKRTEELCLEAVKNHSRAIIYSPYQTHEIVWKAIEADPQAIQFIREPSPELIYMAIYKDPGAVWCVRDRTPEMEELAAMLRLK